MVDTATAGRNLNVGASNVGSLANIKLKAGSDIDVTNFAVAEVGLQSNSLTVGGAVAARNLSTSLTNAVTSVTIDVKTR